MGNVTATKKIDWEELARLHKGRSDNDRPMAAPRILTCRRCGNKDAGAAGWLYCDEHRAAMTTAELVEAGEYHGDWIIGRNRLGNPTWTKKV